MAYSELLSNDMLQNLGKLTHQLCEKDKDIGYKLGKVGLDINLCIKNPLSKNMLEPSYYFQSTATEKHTEPIVIPDWFISSIDWSKLKDLDYLRVVLSEELLTTTVLLPRLFHLIEVKEKSLFKFMPKINKIRVAEHNFKTGSRLRLCRQDYKPMQNYPTELISLSNAVLGDGIFSAIFTRKNSDEIYYFCNRNTSDAVKSISVGNLDSETRIRVLKLIDLLCSFNKVLGCISVVRCNLSEPMVFIAPYSENEEEFIMLVAI